MHNHQSGAEFRSATPAKRHYAPIASHFSCRLQPFHLFLLPNWFSYLCVHTDRYTQRYRRYKKAPVKPNILPIATHRRRIASGSACNHGGGWHFPSLHRTSRHFLHSRVPVFHYSTYPNTIGGLCLFRPDSLASS